MKKSLILMMLASCSLAACTTGNITSADIANGMNTATNASLGVFKYAVDQKCRSEIQNHQAWKLASIAMTTEQQSTTLTKVCGCVSEKAPQSVTMVELGQAAVDSNARTQIVANAVTKTLNSCYNDVFK